MKSSESNPGLSAEERAALRDEPDLLIEGGIADRVSSDASAWRQADRVRVFFDLHPDAPRGPGRPPETYDGPTLGWLAEQWGESVQRLSYLHTNGIFYPLPHRQLDLSLTFYDVARRASNGKLDNALELLEHARTMYMTVTAFRDYCRPLQQRSTDLATKLMRDLPDRPWSAADLRAYGAVRCLDEAAHLEQLGVALDDVEHKRDVVPAVLALKALGLSDDERHTVLRVLFGVTSTKYLNRAELRVACLWASGEYAADEANALLVDDMRRRGVMEWAIGMSRATRAPLTSDEQVDAARGSRQLFGGEDFEGYG